jgi:esterase/lipase superfamily enzyme
MAEYVSDAFLVSVLMPRDDRAAHRERFAVGCSTREEAENRIRELYPSEANIRVFAVALSHCEAEGLKLTAGEYRLHRAIAS